MKITKGGFRLAAWVALTFLLPLALEISCGGGTSTPPAVGELAKGSVPIPTSGTGEHSVAVLQDGSSLIGEVTATSYFTGAMDGGVADGATQGANATARFGIQGPDPVTCTVTDFGACSSKTCTGSGQPTFTPQSAGNVTIHVGPTDGGTTIVMPPGDAGTYAGYVSTTNPLFQGGESMHFSWPGAVAPAGSTSLTAPNAVTITSPLPGDAGTVVLHRTNANVVSWTGGGSGKIHIAVASQVSNVTVICEYLATAGSATLDQSAMATLPAGSATLVMRPRTLAKETVGQYGYTTTAIMQAHLPNGLLYPLSQTITVVDP